MKSTNKDNIIETIEEYISSSPIRPVIRDARKSVKNNLTI